MKHLEEFLQRLKTKHYAKSTMRRYSNVLNRAKRYFEQKSIIDDRDITEAVVFEYLQYLKNIMKSDWMHFRSTVSLKKYFEYLEDEKIIFINPLKSIEIPKEIYRPTKILTQEEIRNDLNKIDTTVDEGLRLRAVLELMYSSALRPMEVPNIKLTDINYKKKTIFIRLSKNKKDRVVPVGKIALYWVDKYITEIRPKYVRNKDNNHIFITHNGRGNQLGSDDLHTLISVNLKKNNIEHFKPSCLRPSSATHLLQNGMGLLHIKELLGHEQVTTTQIYLRVKERDLKRELELKHPRYKKQITMEEKNEI